MTTERDPLAEGLVYHTIVLQGRMVHLGRHHLLMVDFASGRIMSFDWDEVLVGLLQLQVERGRVTPATSSIVTVKPNSRLARFMRDRVVPKDRPA